VGGTGVSVGGSGVAVGGSGVAVGGSGVSVGGSGVSVGGSGVLVGGSGVSVADGIGTGVSLGMAVGVKVGGTKNPGLPSNSVGEAGKYGIRNEDRKTANSGRPVEVWYRMRTNVTPTGSRLPVQYSRFESGRTASQVKSYSPQPVRCARNVPRGPAGM
jgi:hypothetical protein